MAGTVSESATLQAATAATAAISAATTAPAADGLSRSGLCAVTTMDGARCLQQGPAAVSGRICNWDAASAHTSKRSRAASCVDSADAFRLNDSSTIARERERSFARQGSLASANHA